MSDELVPQNDFEAFAHDPEAESELQAERIRRNFWLMLLIIAIGILIPVVIALSVWSSL